jgi:hypothetical protein
MTTLIWFPGMLALCGFLLFLWLHLPGELANVLHWNLFVRIFGLLLLAAGAFFLTLGSSVWTAKSRAIYRYLRTIKMSLSWMEDYQLPPGFAPVYHDYLSRSIADRTANQQSRHVMVLGQPGSGKSEILKYAIYQVTKVNWWKKQRIPLVIQMKYYDAYWQSGPETPTLLNYLLKKAQKSPRSTEQATSGFQYTQANELIGVYHLRPFLEELLQEGRLVLLCDGMNELGQRALDWVQNDIQRLMHTPNNIIMTCRQIEYQDLPLIRGLTRDGVIIDEALPGQRQLPARAEVTTLDQLSAMDVAQVVSNYLENPEYKRSANRRDPTGKRRRGEALQAEEVQQYIERTNKPHRFTSPFMVTILMNVLHHPDVRQHYGLPRGRLLQIAVGEMLGDWRVEEARQVQEFLSVLAYAARSNGERNATASDPRATLCKSF